MRKLIKRILITSLALTMLVGAIAPALADEAAVNVWTVKPFNNSGTPSVGVTNDLVANTSMVKVSNPGFAARGTGWQNWNGFVLTSPDDWSMTLNQNTTSFTFDIIYQGPGTTNRAFYTEVRGFDADGNILFYDAQAAGTATNNAPVTGWRQIAVNSAVAFTRTGPTVLDKVEITLQLNNVAFNTPVYISNFRVGTTAIPTTYVRERYSNQTILTEENLDIPLSVKTADANATQTTRNLFAYLYAVGKSPYVLWGAQNPDHSPGFTGWTFPSVGDVDIMNLTGNWNREMAARPAIMGFDTLSFFAHEGHSSGMGFPATRDGRIQGNVARSALWADTYGGVVHLTMHAPNFGLVVDFANSEQGGQPASYYNMFNNGRGSYVSSGSVGGLPAYGCLQTNGSPMQRILPGGDANRAFTEYLDLIVEYALGLQEKDVPIIFRPFHELNGDFFWWGAPFSTPEQFKNAWRYAVDYIRGKGANNILYCYNFNAGVADLEAFESRYAGDGYVDMVSFDAYPQHGDPWRVSLNSLTRFAEERGKIVAIAEYGSGATGPTGNLPNSHAHILRESTGRDGTTGAVVPGSVTNVSWMMAWTNGSMYPQLRTSHTRASSATNATGASTFIRDFINDSASVFTDGVFSLEKIRGLEVLSGGGHPQAWVVYPQASSSMLAALGDNESLTVSASLKDITGDVTIRLSSPVGANVERAAVINEATGFYEVVFTREEIEAKVWSAGDILVLVDGAVLGQTVVVFGDLAVRQPWDIDNFEYRFYFGSNQLLRDRWPLGRGSGELMLNLQQKWLDPRDDSEYGFEYAYGLGDGFGYVGTSLSFSPTQNWNEYNAIQFYCKPDGMGQQFQIQIGTTTAPPGGTWNTRNREFVLTLFAETTEPMIITIPFAQFGSHGGDPVTRPPLGFGNGGLAGVNTFGIFLNERLVNGEDIRVNSSIYFDDFKLLTLTADELAALNISRASNGIQDGADFKHPCLDFDGHRPGEVNVILEPTCLEDGAWEQTCLVCHNILDDGDIPGLGHDIDEYVCPGDDTVLVNECVREGCDFIEFFERSIADILITRTPVIMRGLNTSQVVLTGKTLVLLLPGIDPIILSTNANNRNIGGVVELPDGSGTLIFDIKGNGSNIKVFKIIKN